MRPRLYRDPRGSNGSPPFPPPRHVHVRRDRAVCKCWLEPVVLAYNNGFSAKELNRIRKIILDHLGHIREAWDEHCGQ